MKERCDRLLHGLAEKDIDSAIITSPVNMRYYSGFTGGEGAFVIGPAGRALLTDFRYTIQARSECNGTCEVREINHSIGSSDIEAILKEFGARRVGFEDACLTVAEFERFKAIDFELVPASGIINSGRLIKDEYEISQMQRAQSIADAAFEKLLKFIKPGMTELDVRNELDYYMRKLGADENSFDTIVGSGPNGALCHAYPGMRKLRSGDMVVMDFGCKVNGYCSDMTRTVAIGEPCDELKKIYNIVLQAQLKCLSVLKPNMSARDLDLTARNYIADNGYGECFGHSLGHGFGLEIHENPFASFRSQETLLPGMTVTVEPGIYIEGLGGVRIEDCCVLTETGYINFAKSPKELIIL